MTSVCDAIRISSFHFHPTGPQYKRGLNLSVLGPSPEAQNYSVKLFLPFGKMGRREKRNKKKKPVNGSVRSIFMHADGVDMVLMLMGFIGAVADGFSSRMVLLFVAKILNNIGNASKMHADTLQQNLNKVVYLYHTLFFAYQISTYSLNNAFFFFFLGW